VAQREAELKETELPGLSEIIRRSLRAADIAFNSPTTMFMNRFSEITLILSLENKDSFEELVGSLAKATEGSVRTATISAAPVMSAQLSGYNFTIEQTTPREQAISPTGTIEWKWRVKPQQTGPNQVLTLTLYARLPIEEFRYGLSKVKTFQARITVDAFLWDRVLSAINVVPAVIYIIAAIATIVGALAAILKRPN